MTSSVHRSNFGQEIFLVLPVAPVHQKAAQMGFPPVQVSRHGHVGSRTVPVLSGWMLGFQKVPVCGSRLVPV